MTWRTSSQALLAVSLVLGPTGCGNGKQGVAEAGAERKESGVDDDKLLERLGRADLVFVGKPVKLHTSPGAWSGRYEVYQEVEYAVARYLKGRAPNDHGPVVVSHLLLQGARTADPDAPRLSGSFFAPDRTLIVLARVDKGQIVALDANYSVAPATDEIVTAVERRLAEAPR